MSLRVGVFGLLLLLVPNPATAAKPRLLLPPHLLPRVKGWRRQDVEMLSQTLERLFQQRSPHGNEAQAIDQLQDRVSKRMGDLGVLLWGNVAGFTGGALYGFSDLRNVESLLEFVDFSLFDRFDSAALIAGFATIMGSEVVRHADPGRVRHTEDDRVVGGRIAVYVLNRMLTQERIDGVNDPGLDLLEKLLTFELPGPLLKSLRAAEDKHGLEVGQLERFLRQKIEIGWNEQVETITSEADAYSVTVFEQRDGRKIAALHLFETLIQAGGAMLVPAPFRHGLFFSAGISGFKLYKRVRRHFSGAEYPHLQKLERALIDFLDVKVEPDPESPVQSAWYEVLVSDKGARDTPYAAPLVDVELTHRQRWR